MQTKRRFKGSGLRISALGPAILLLLSTCAGSDAVVGSTPAATSQISKWCLIGGTPVHYVDSAVCQSEVSLLIVHGYLGSTVSFLTLIEAVSPDLRVVMPDLPAFGDSGVPGCDCTMEYYLDFLDAFTQAVGLDRCFLMGTSMGANIAAHYTVQHLEQVQGLIFLSPFGLQDQAGRGGSNPSDPRPLFDEWTVAADRPAGIDSDRFGG